MAKDSGGSSGGKYGEKGNMGGLRFSPNGEVQIDYQVEVGWTEKEWARTVTRATRASDQSWARQVAGRDDLGDYEEKQQELQLAAYMKMGSTKSIRKEIIGRMERGKHWV